MWPADYAPLFRPMRLGVLQASHDALTDDIVLQLGHRADDCEHSLAHGCGSIQCFLRADKIDSEGAELSQGKHELLDGTTNLQTTTTSKASRRASCIKALSPALSFFAPLMQSV
jgi:hypothetical protein